MSGAETVAVTLLPCPLPWCGSSAVRLRYWQGNKRVHYVECECCKIKTQQSRSKERVIAAWNTRATAPLIEALEAAREVVRLYPAGEPQDFRAAITRLTAALAAQKGEG